MENNSIINQDSKTEQVNWVSPVGDATPTNIWGAGWISATRHGQEYAIRPGIFHYHTGEDLNLNVPKFDSDKLRPVVSIGAGTVVHAGVLPGTWGNVVVIQYEGFCVRYAHLDRILVAKGQPVKAGEQIGNIGNSFGQFPYHLHIDAAKDDWLAKFPADWPGTNLDRVNKYYLNIEVLLKSLITGKQVIYYVSAEPSLNIRESASAKSKVLGRVFYGDKVVVDDRKLADTTGANIAWVKLSGKAGYVAYENNGEVYLVTTKPPPIVKPDPVPTPIPSVPPAKSRKGIAFGFNAVGNGAYNQWLDLLGALAAAGKPAASVIVSDEHKLVRNIKSVSPSTFVVYRATNMPENPELSGNWDTDYKRGVSFFNQNYGAHLQVGMASGADAVQVCNEQTPQIQPFFNGRVAAEIGILDAANAIGVRTTVWGMNSGQPINAALEAALYPLLKKAADTNHIWNYHGYSRPGTNDFYDQKEWLVLRYERYTKQFPNLKVIIGEAGFDQKNAAFVGVDETIRALRELEDIFRLKPNVIGVCWWAACEMGNWKHSDASAAIPAIKQLFGV